MSHVVLFANPVKLNNSTKNTVTKILPKKLYLKCHCDQKNPRSNFKLNGRTFSNGPK